MEENVQRTDLSDFYKANKAQIVLRQIETLVRVIGPEEIQKHVNVDALVRDLLSNIPTEYRRDHTTNT